MGERAYFRDASWYANPDVSKPKRAHRDSGDGTPACSPQTVLLVMESFVDVDTAGDLLCRRCWPTTHPPALRLRVPEPESEQEATDGV